MDLDEHRSERQRGGRPAGAVCEWRFTDGSGGTCGKVATHILRPTGLPVCAIHAGVMDSLLFLGLSRWADGSWSRERAGGRGEDEQDGQDSLTQRPRGEFEQEETEATEEGGRRAAKAES